MYGEERTLLAGHPASKHSMNQRQMKMTADRTRRYFRDHPHSVAESDQCVRSSTTIVDSAELRGLLSTGVYGLGRDAELAAAVHVVGSLISRVLPVQLGRAV